MSISSSSASAASQVNFSTEYSELLLMDISDAVFRKALLEGEITIKAPSINEDAVAVSDTQT